MTIPDFQSLMHPVLAVLDDGQTHTSRELKSAMVDEFNLLPVERERMLPSGRQRVIDNRVGWSLTYLVQAGLAHRPQRAHFQITDSGRQALRTHPSRIDMKVLEAYPSYRDFKDRKSAKTSTVVDQLSMSAADQTPEDLLEAAVAENRAAVEGDVLKMALALTPTGFEDLVIRLLESMATAGPARSSEPAPPAMPEWTASSAKIRLGLIGSTCKPSDTRLTGRSTGRVSMSSPVRSSASKATGVCSSRHRPFPAVRGRRPSESTPGSNSSTGRASPSCW